MNYKPQYTEAALSLQVTLINFTVTKLGLEDQILSDVVRLERPDLEVRRNQLILKYILVGIIGLPFFKKLFLGTISFLY